MTANKDQKKQIRANFGYDVGLKEEAVQWATGDNSKRSLNDLTYEQADAIIRRQTGKEFEQSPAESWAWFDKNNKRHMLILSLCRQAQWVTMHPKLRSEVVDLDRLSNWLKSDKSPVQKKLTKMDAVEIEKIIKALRGIVKSKYK
jgi:hypothetical protein